MFSNVIIKSDTRDINLDMDEDRTAELEYGGTDEGVRFAILTVTHTNDQGVSSVLFTLAVDHVVIKNVSHHELYLIGYTSASPVQASTRPTFARTNPEHVALRLTYR